MKHLILSTAFLICLSGYSQPSPQVQKTTPSISLFEEGIVNTFLNERDFAISPDGKEIYFTVTTPRSSIQTIVYCRKTGLNGWSKPEVVSFSGEFSDLEPAFAPDGKALYFASNRPLSGSMPKDFDLWKVERAGSGWGSPLNLGPVINTAGDEFYPSVTSTGKLFFTAAYSGGPGKEDIYVSDINSGSYATPVALDTAVNSRVFEFNAFVSPDEKFILFTSYGRKDDTGGGDLYISVRKDGKWQHARNVKEINSKRLDYCPYVSPGGKTLFFTSDRADLPVKFSPKRASYEDIVGVSTKTLNGNGNIYFVDFSILQDYLKEK